MAETTIEGTRLQISNMCCTYDRSVLRGVNVSVRRGETVALIGRSGSGKSTLLRCISLNEKPDCGDGFLDGQQYLRDGEPQYEEWEVRRNIMLVYQDFALFPQMSVAENITFALRKTKQLSHREAFLLAEETASQLGIADHLKNYPRELSGGQAQRLALARAMVLRPKVLLLDEITAALDPETTHSVIAAVRALRTLAGTEDMSILLVTHLLPFAVQFAD